MRIGLFGGSFDPIHTGHAIIANVLSQLGDVDEVWLMPGRINPLKTDGPAPAAPEHRLAMCRMVADRCRNVRVTDIEMSLPEPSYSYRTLCELRRIYPEHQFVMLIGSDNWQAIRRWRDWEKIIAEFGFVIYSRPGCEAEGPLPPGVTKITDMPGIHISSTLVRQAIADGLNVDYLVPVDVACYIEQHKLYKR